MIDSISTNPARHPREISNEWLIHITFLFLACISAAILIVLIWLAHAAGLIHIYEHVYQGRLDEQRYQLAGVWFFIGAFSVGFYRAYLQSLRENDRGQDVGILRMFWLWTVGTGLACIVAMIVAASGAGLTSWLGPYAGRVSMNPGFAYPNWIWLVLAAIAAVSGWLLLVRAADALTSTEHAEEAGATHDPAWGEGLIPLAIWWSAVLPLWTYGKVDFYLLVFKVLLFQFIVIWRMSACSNECDGWERLLSAAQSWFGSALRLLTVACGMLLGLVALPFALGVEQWNPVLGRLCFVLVGAIALWAGIGGGWELLRVPSSRVAAKNHA